MDKQYYRQYYHQERSHWWFLARLQILEDQIIQIAGARFDHKILNIGIATGATSIMLERYGEAFAVRAVYKSE